MFRIFRKALESLIFYSSARTDNSFYVNLDFEPVLCYNEGIDNNLVTAKGKNAQIKNIPGHIGD